MGYGDLVETLNDDYLARCLTDAVMEGFASMTGSTTVTITDANGDVVDFSIVNKEVIYNQMKNDMADQWLAFAKGFLKFLRSPPEDLYIGSSNNVHINTPEA